MLMPASTATPLNASIFAIGSDVSIQPSNADLTVFDNPNINTSCPIPIATSEVKSIKLSVSSMYEPIILGLLMPTEHSTANSYLRLERYMMLVTTVVMMSIEMMMIRKMREDITI